MLLEKSWESLGSQSLKLFKSNLCRTPGSKSAAKGMIPRVGLLNNPPHNPEDYNQGTAIYVNEPGFDSIVLGSRKPNARRSKG